MTERVPLALSANRKLEPWLDYLSLREAQRRSNLEDGGVLRAASLTLLTGNYGANRKTTNARTVSSRTGRPPAGVELAMTVSSRAGRPPAGAERPDLYGSMLWAAGITSLSARTGRCRPE